jgi:hypothetical protein
LDADGLTLACATAAELRVGRRSGLPAALVGLAGANGFPAGPLVSFGLAGALRGDLPSGTVLDATRVVDSAGHLLWEGAPLGVPGARPGTVLAADDVVDDPAERLRLHELTGADVADLESGPIAATGRMRGCLRAVSDTPERPLNGICAAVDRQGRYDWSGLVRAFARSPRGFTRAAGDARRALGELAKAAERLT